jgi:hypothetical protein
MGLEPGRPIHDTAKKETDVFLNPAIYLKLYLLNIVFTDIAFTERCFSKYIFVERRTH